jgi:ABC-type multidrug transport system ATPase subunit
LIEIQELRKIYPDGTRALDGIDLTFGEGMTGLLGPNGAGKTTLLSILVLAREPSAGRRVYFGVDDRPAHRARIRSMLGYLPQELHLLQGLSGIEYLRYCAGLRRVPLRSRDLERRLWALLDAVELRSAAHRRADTYSGGMQRRLGLAQSLVHGPRLLVVDEPTAGLDPEERIRFRNLITELAEEIPVLLSTHIVEDIEATCPRLVIIARGRVLFDGAPGEILRRAEGRLWRLPVDAPVPEGMLVLGQRVGEGGRVDRVLFGEQVPGASPLEPQLEEACGALLAREGVSLHDDPDQPMEEGAE